MIKFALCSLWGVVVMCWTVLTACVTGWLQPGCLQSASVQPVEMGVVSAASAAGEKHG